MVAQGEKWRLKVPHSRRNWPQLRLDMAMASSQYREDSTYLRPSTRSMMPNRRRFQEWTVHSAWFL